MRRYRRNRDVRFAFSDPDFVKFQRAMDTFVPGFTELVHRGAIAADAFKKFKQKYPDIVYNREADDALNKINDTFWGLRELFKKLVQAEIKIEDHIKMWK